MDDLKQHFLVCDRIHQTIGAKKQIFPCFQGADVAVALGIRVGTQRTGDEIAVGMATCLLSGDITPIHHTLNQ